MDPPAKSWQPKKPDVVPVRLHVALMKIEMARNSLRDAHEELSQAVKEASLAEQYHFFRFLNDGGVGSEELKTWWQTERQLRHIYRRRHMRLVSSSQQDFSEFSRVYCARNSGLSKCKVIQNDRS